MSIKCGFVAVVGRPNAGKSSLVNAIIGEKVSIVSPKPQTTRNNILGIYNSNDSQIIFIDTPGINSGGSELDKYMQRSVKGALEDICVVLLVVDATKGISKMEKDMIDKFYHQIPVVLVLSKCDLIDSSKIYKTLESLMELSNKCEMVPTSSLKHKNLESIVRIVEKYLPEMESRYYDEDDYTDKPVKFLVSEIVREKALYLLKDEIPHGIAVFVEKYEDAGAIDNIDLVIICEKESHKAIILGRNGSMLKDIGHTARLTIQKVLHKKVNLNLFVKVKPNWKNNMDILVSLGYDKNDL